MCQRLLCTGVTIKVLQVPGPSQLPFTRLPLGAWCAQEDSCQKGGEPLRLLTASCLFWWLLEPTHSLPVLLRPATIAQDDYYEEAEELGMEDDDDEAYLDGGC